MVAQKAALRGRHDLGEIVGYGYRIYLKHFGVLFAVALLTVPVEMLSGVVRGMVNEDAAQAVNTLFQIPLALVGIIAASAIIFAVHEVTGGAAPSFGRSLDAVFERMAAVFGSLFLGAGLAVLAVFAFPFLGPYWLIKRDANIDGQRAPWMWLVPFALVVYLVLRWSMVQQAVMIDGKQNWSALDASADAVRGAWWRVLGIGLVISLIQAGPVLLAGAAVLLPPLAAATIGGLALALVLPFQSAAQTLLYYDLKARKQTYADDFVSVD